MRRPTKLRLALLVLPLVLGSGLARAQPAPSVGVRTLDPKQIGAIPRVPVLRIERAMLLPPDTVRVRIFYWKLGVAPALTMTIGGASLRATGVAPVAEDRYDADFTLPPGLAGKNILFELTAGNPSAGELTVPAYYVDLSGRGIVPLGDVLPPLDAPALEPSWVDAITWKTWVSLVVLGLGAVAWMGKRKPATPVKLEPPEKQSTLVSPPPPPPGRPVRLFFSYAHEDDVFREQLIKHLATLRRSGMIDAWNDRRIAAGQDWAQQVDENLEKAEIIVLLISPDFLSSDYCYDVEMKRALERHARDEAIVVPIIVRPTDWSEGPFKALQAVPRDGVPISRWEDRDEAWLDVVMSLRELIEARDPARSVRA